MNIHVWIHCLIMSYSTAKSLDAVSGFPNPIALTTPLLGCPLSHYLNLLTAGVPRLGSVLGALLSLFMLILLVTSLLLVLSSVYMLLIPKSRSRVLPSLLNSRHEECLLWSGPVGSCHSLRTVMHSPRDIGLGPSAELSCTGSQQNMGNNPWLSKLGGSCAPDVETTAASCPQPLSPMPALGGPSGITNCSCG